MAPLPLGGKLGGKGARGPFRNNVVADLSQLQINQDYIQSSLDEDWQLSSEDDDFSYYSGPLSDDAIVVLDLIANQQEDIDQTDDAEYDFSYWQQDDVVAATDLVANWTDDDIFIEDAEYDFTFSLLEDSQVYTAQFDDDELQDEADYSFAYWQQDDVSVTADQLQNGIDDEQPIDEADYDFSFSLIEDAQIYAASFIENDEDDTADYDFAYWQQDDIAPEPDLIWAYLVDDEDEQPEYDFYLGPISSDFIFIDEIAYGSFDEFDENFEGEEFSFQFSIVGDDAQIVPVIVDQTDYHDGFKRKTQHEYAREHELKRKAELEASIARAVETVSATEKPQSVKKTVLTSLVKEYRNLLAALNQIKQDEDIVFAMMLLQ